MPTPFSSTHRSLETDRPGWSRVAAWLAGIFFVTGLVWASFARVPVHVRADNARVEVEGKSFQVHNSSHAGSVVAAHIALEQRVEAGQVLLELEPHLEVHQLDAERARLASLRGEVYSTREQLEQQRAALDHDQRSRGYERNESLARLREASLRSETSAAQYHRARALFGEGLIPTSELEDRRGIALADSAIVASLHASVDRVRSESDRWEADRRAEIARLEAKLSHLEGEAKISETALHAFEHELDHFAIRAPVGGTLAQVANVKPGSYLEAGAWIATIVPDGPVQLVASMQVSATGRIAAGQSSRFWLDAFEWTEYGAVHATVRRVAQDTFGNSIQAEFAISPESGHAIPLRHGMTGTIEVEVERISPIRLAIRSIGKRMRSDAVARRVVDEAPPGLAHSQSTKSSGTSTPPAGLDPAFHGQIETGSLGGFGGTESSVRSEEEDEDERTR